MTNTIVNPTTIAAPIGAYSHGVIATGPGQLLHVSGRVGILPDGTLVDGFVRQGARATGMADRSRGGGVSWLSRAIEAPRR